MRWFGRPASCSTACARADRVSPRTLEQRRHVLLTTLAALQLQWNEEPPPVVDGLRQVRGSWKGLGQLVDGLLAQDLDVELVHYPSGWRASFYPAGPTHSLVRGAGSARAATAWDALQGAAWEALSAREPPPGS